MGEWHVLLHDDIPSGKHRLSFHRKRRVHTDKFVVEAIVKVCGELVTRKSALSVAHAAHKSGGEAVVLTTDKATANEIRDKLALYGLSVTTAPKAAG